MRQLFGILFIYICHDSVAQMPVFTSSLVNPTPVFCKGANVEITAQFQNATSFYVERFNNNSWTKVSTGTASGTNIYYTEFNVTESLSFRAIVKNGLDSAISNTLTISPVEPSFSYHPLDNVQCNGLIASFRISANSITNYQWQVSSNGGSTFQNITDGTKYAGVNTAALSVKNLVNADHNLQFRCYVKDNRLCEAFSNPAKLIVNQLSTVVQPTTSTTFCEAEKAKIFVEASTGEVTSRQWQMKKSTSSTYLDVSGSKYQGITSDTLKINGINTGETSYRIKVSFKNNIQGSSGSPEASTCEKIATRTNYIINAKPAMPAQIDSIMRCGPGSINAIMTNSVKVNWYADSLLVPLSSASSTFTTPSLNASRKFFYNIKDVNQCNSFYREFKAVINNIPTFKIIDSVKICNEQETISLNLDSLKNNPITFSFLNGTSSIPNTVEKINESISSSIVLNIPRAKSAGSYTHQLSVHNQFCTSSSKPLVVKVRQKSSININPVQQKLCEGSSFQLIPTVITNDPSQFTWYKNGTVLSGNTLNSIIISNVSPADSGKYQLKMNDVCGETSSEIFDLKVLEKPVILNQPIARKICEGDTLKFNIEARASGTIDYQWYINNEKVGINSPKLVIPLADLKLNTKYVKCAVKADCDPAVLSDSVKIDIEKTPESPTVLNPVGYCQQANTTISLPQSTITGNSYKWFDINNLNIQNIDLSTSSSKNYSVFTESRFGCKSPTITREVIVSPRFDFDLSSSSSAICISGNFNTSSTLLAATKIDLGVNYSFYKGSKVLDVDNIGEFTVNDTGSYQVLGRLGHCEILKSISILPLGQSLAHAISSNNAPICKNSDADLLVTSANSGGKYYWWRDSTDIFSIAEGASFKVNNVQSDSSFHVSYIAPFQSVYCETNRSNIIIKLKDPLQISASTDNISCIGKTDGKITIIVKNGVSPYRYTLNSTNNTTGVFSSLTQGTYSLTVTDSKGCSFDSTLTISLNPSTIVSIDPLDISRCKGNIVNFTCAASNYDQLIWQKKTPGSLEFLDIPGATESPLRIENSGNADYPHLTEFRAKFTKASCSTFSKSATMRINSVSGSTNILKVCDNKPVSIDLTKLTIIGNIKSYQWQKRQGTTGSFVDIPNENSQLLSLPNPSDGAYYGCKLVFQNEPTHTCTIGSTSTSSTLISQDSTKTPTISGPNIACKGSTVNLVASNCNGDSLIWSTGFRGPNLSLIVSSDTSFLVSCFKNTCPSKNSTLFSIKIVGGSPNLIPVNETPTQIVFGDTLRFKASGPSLKWYEDSTSTIFSTVAPIRTQVGTYTFWVSATDECEGRRIKIISTIIPKFAIILEPSNFLNCKGNSANFDCVATGDNVTYQWQKKLPNSLVFIDIVNVDPNHVGMTSSKLNVSNVGNLNNPHNTSFRCMVTEMNIIKYSKEALLKVNSLNGNLPNVTVCDEMSYIIDLKKTHTIIGEPIKLNWEFKKSGEDWNVIQNSSSDSTSLQIDNVGAYRAQYTFVSNNGTCVESTDLMNFEKVTKPNRPINQTFDFCAGDKSPDWKIAIPNGSKILYYNSQLDLLSKKPVANTNSAGQQRYYYSLAIEESCPSEKSNLIFDINPEPKVPISTTVLETEEGSILKFTAIGENLKWYANSTTKTFSNTEPQETKVGKHDYFVSQTSAFGCESDRLKVFAEIKEAFAIELQPKSAGNCEGNIITFSIKIKGELSPKYQWQKLINDSFQNLEGETSKELKLRDIGKLEDGTQYRCQVSNGKKIIDSQPAMVSLYGFKNSISDFSICEGAKFLDSTMLIKLIGNAFSKIDVQLKSGSTYISETFTPLEYRPLKDGEYRLNVTFGNNTCTRTSNNFKLTLNKIPINPATLEICEGTTIASLNSQKNTNFEFYEENKKKGHVEVLSAGNKYQVSSTSDKGCVSIRSTIIIQSLRKPDNSILPPTMEICKYQEFVLFGKDTLNIFEDSLMKLPIEMRVDIPKPLRIFAAIKSVCSSTPKSISISMQDCYADINDDVDLCVNEDLNLEVNKWTDVLLKNPLIHYSYFAKNTQRASVKIGYYKFLQESFVNRSIQVRFPVKPKEPIKYRMYFKEEKLPAKSIGLVSLDLDANCNSFNPKPNTIIKPISITKASQKGYIQLEFPISETGNYGFIKIEDLIEKLNLKKSGSFIQIEIINSDNKNQYEIWKKDEDGNFTIKIPFEKLNNIIDNNPSIGANEYVLYKIYHKDLKLPTDFNTIGWDKTNCFLISNPESQKNDITFIFNDLDKSTTMVSDLTGKILPLKNVFVGPNYNTMNFESNLMPGTYILKASTKTKNTCYFRFVIY